MRLLDLLKTVKRDGITPGVLKACSDDEIKIIMSILDEYKERGTSKTLDLLWSHDFEERPVGIDEFLGDDYYFGKIGKDVYPKWMPELKKVCAPLEGITEWIITGSIGCGKTYVGVIALIYKMYFISCLRDPQSFYDLGKGTPIVFGLFDIFKYLAKATSYTYLVTWLRDMSPYFKKFRVPGKKDTDKNVLDLPKGMSVALGAQAIHALGQNILGGLCDEAEFGRAKSVSSQEKSQVADLYQQARERIDSRFMQGGGVNPGLLILVSSAKDTEGFLTPHIRARRHEKSVHVSGFALYEVKEQRFKDSPRFKVVVGDRFHKSCIVDNGEDIRAGAQVLEVPVEFLPSFRLDIDSAIRNIAGVPTVGANLFYPRKDQLKALLEKCTRKHPFSSDTIELSIDDSIFIEDYFNADMVAKLVMKSAKVRSPKWYPKARRYVHVDLAKNRDCAGIAMVCLPSLRKITRVIKDDTFTVEDYVVFVDFVLTIRAAQGSEIDLSKVRRFILYLLQKCRFPIKVVTYDQYQSLESIQGFKKLGITASELSVDRNPGPYRALKQIALEGRLDIYYHEPFFREMVSIRDYTQDSVSVKHKIDHPPGGSKDATDAVCGAATSALKDHKAISNTGTSKGPIRNMQPQSRSLEKNFIRIISSDSTKNPLDALFPENS